jgi:hypothetical protein
MAYQPLDLNNETILDATHLNHVEDALVDTYSIEEVDDAIDAAIKSVTDVVEPAIINGESLTNYTYTWNTSVKENLIITSSAPVKLNLTNIPINKYLTVSISGNSLDEDYLSSQGFTLTTPYTYISVTDASTQRYVYTFIDDGVKHITRMVM